MKHGRCSFNGCTGEPSMFVKCGHCMKHFHAKCVQLLNREFQSYIMKKSNYICMSCKYLLRNENSEMKVGSTAGMDDSESNDGNLESDLYQNGYESNMINNLSQASSVSRDRSPSPSGHVSPVMRPFSGDLHNNINSQLSQSSVDSNDEQKF